MTEDFLLRAEHTEFARRMEVENKLQNDRLEKIENTLIEVQALTRSVDKLATNMEHMLKEQTKQGERLEIIESRDGEKWRSIMGHIATTIVGAVTAYVIMKLGLG